MVFSLLSFSLSNFFFTLVFRVSYKTLKLGEVKISSVVAFFIHQAAKKQGRFNFLSQFFKLKHRRRIKSPHLFSSSSSLYIYLLCRTERRDTHFREEEDECGESSVESIYSFSEILTRRNNGE